MIRADPTEVAVYPDPNDPQRFFYVPGEPVPELGPNGAPALTLLLADAASRLQLGARWTVDGATLDRLRRRVASEHPELDPARIDLQPAPARVREVALLLRDAGGTRRDLAHATSSGFTPHTALFAVPLASEEERLTALRAVHGTEDVLGVRYTADVLGEGGQWQTVTREGDVGRWFRGLSADGHLLFAPGVSPTKPVSPPPDLPSSVTFQVQARARDMPVAFVTVTWGTETATLRPPDFAPGSLGTSKGPVEVTTRYMVGGGPYTTRLTPTGDTCDLGPTDLGLCEVVLDAERCPSQGVREVRAQMTYRPDGDGPGDERTVYLRGGTWTDRWWLVTRAPDLAGTLEVKLKITRTDGTTLDPPRFSRKDPFITIPLPDDGEVQEDNHDSD
ncbi:hypothetical protein [Deinococcus planocerae]|uniref:hypothetical protein n=1 Tax=Deinococcus planocerae TaxID=1737569 RepID=UPI000C7EA510|nr:hypothetical protein [Deinococcus planocerae]